jgi:hypothetical protein
MHYEWIVNPVPDDAAPRDPWAYWATLRPGTNRRWRALCASTKSQRPDAMPQGWQVPLAYAGDAPFFTAWRPREQPTPRGSPGAGLPGLDPGHAVGANEEMSLVVDVQSVPLRLKHFGINRPKSLPAFQLRSFGTGVMRVLPLPNLGVGDHRRMSASQAIDRAAPSGKVRIDRSERPATTPAVVPPEGASDPPIIGIIDTAIAFLHRAFRAPDDKARFIALWDQDDPADSPDPPMPWHRPVDFGYGRELGTAEVDTLLSEWAALPSDRTESGIYERVGHPRPTWSHGTQVLALAAGSPDSGAPARSSDGASVARIVAVQLPELATQRTHGNWLGAYILDGLHFILNRAPQKAPVVVNISLGAYSGPHDGSSMLERAIDELIKSQQGRLTVVIAAGNSRTHRTHARITLAPGRSVDLPIDMEPRDASPNFIETWLISTKNLKKVTARLVPPGADVSESPELDLGDASLLNATCLVRVSDDGTQGQAFAMLHALAPGSSPNGMTGTQILAGIGQPQRSTQQPAEHSLSGVWTLRYRNNSSNAVALNAWIARDDTVFGSQGLDRRDHGFASTDDELVSDDGTMSNLAWTSHAIAVGGFVAATDSAPATMYERSGSGFAPGTPEAADGRRAGPDLCAMAKSASDEFEPISYLSLGGRPPGMSNCEGTSLAAPLVTRALLNQLARLKRFAVKPALLSELRAHAPSVPISPTHAEYWTGPYWLPVSRP